MIASALYILGRVCYNQGMTTQRTSLWTDKPRTVTLPLDLDGTTKSLVVFMLEEVGVFLLDYELPPNFWEVVNREGKFVKRLRKFLRARGVILDNDLFGAIGDVVGTCSATRNYTYDTTNDLTWSAGDFGDAGSCFWSSDSAALQLLEENGAGAIRIYDADLNGVGRCWVWPYHGDPPYVIFNAYGFPLTVFARLIGAVVEEAGHYRTVHITNEGTSYGVLYVNGGRGLVVGTQEQVEKFGEWINFQWGDPTTTCTCVICEREVDPGCAEDVDGECYCVYCFGEVFARCCVCGDVVDLSYACTVAGKDYCKECYHAGGGVRCPRCGEYFWRENTFLHRRTARLRGR